MQVRLAVAHSKANVKRVNLAGDTVIGRSTDCNLRIASQEVSRRHCRIAIDGVRVLVRDLGSSNGTFVDGRRLEANRDVEIAPGAELRLGGVRFVVQFEPPEPGGEPMSSTAELPAFQGEAESPAADQADDEAPSAGEDEEPLPVVEDSATEGDGAAADAIEETLQVELQDIERDADVEVFAETDRNPDSDEPESAVIQEAVIEEDEPQQPRRSLFGLLRRGKRSDGDEDAGEPPAERDAEPEVEAVEPDESAAAPPSDEPLATEAAGGDREPDDEDGERLVEETEPDDEEAVEREQVPAEAGVSDDDVVGFLADASDDEEEKSAGDGELGDFLKQFE